MTDNTIKRIEAEARRYAEMYPQSSDGRNTFVIFADWVAGLTTAAQGALKPVAWQWRYVGERDWKTPVGGRKLTLEELESCHPIEERPLYASPITEGQCLSVATVPDIVKILDDCWPYGHLIAANKLLEKYRVTELAPSHASTNREV